jgi:ATP-binding cassette subfamily C protein LapB
MVALARALMSSATLILLDEPTSAFDETGEQILLQALHTELEGRTLIVATHRHAPLGLAKRLVILDAGQVVADGPRNDVLKAVREGHVKRAAAAAPTVSTVSPRISVTPVGAAA